MTTCLRFESTSSIFEWYTTDVDIGADGNEIIFLPLREVPSKTLSMNDMPRGTGTPKLLSIQNMTGIQLYLLDM